jgi:hypothetical protein
MASNINPNNINGAYPVAGQDNDSQGFRDNFTNTQTNFAFAAAEITDLQNNAVLKGPLSGTILNNNMNESILSNAQLQDMSETRVNIGTVSGLQTLNFAQGPYQTLTTSGSVVLNFSNFPTAGTTSGRMRVQIAVANTSHTVTFTAGSSWVNASGIQGCAVSGTDAVITFAATGTYEFEIETITAGSVITINEVNKALQPFNSTKEDLADGDGANLAVSASYFSTSAGETATLAAGVEGQVKVFAMFADSGDMVITVANAGWQSSGTGTITFASIGDACTLQYINGKWFCIGNNGCSFA